MYTLGGVSRILRDSDTTIRIKPVTKQKLDDLEFARKNTSYNEIIEKLVVEYNKLSKLRGVR